MNQLGTVFDILYGNCFIDYNITITICANSLFTFSLQVITKGGLELGCDIWQSGRPC
jgi:hypothetical protein